MWRHACYGTANVLSTLIPMEPSNAMKTNKKKKLKLAVDFVDGFDCFFFFIRIVNATFVCAFAFVFQLQFHAVQF